MIKNLAMNFMTSFSLRARLTATRNARQSVALTTICHPIS